MTNKKKKSLLIIVILLVLFGIYAYRTYLAPQDTDAETHLALATDAPEASDATETIPDTETTADAEVSSALLLLDGEADTVAPEGPVPDVTADSDSAPDEPVPVEVAPAIDEQGAYTGRDDVALYIHTYGHLPDNFITKKEAEALGWEGGGLDDFAYGKCIGGSHYGNYEGLLPEKSGRRYTECDIDTQHRSSRGAKRIVFSNDGLVYYTADHYDSFTLLYGEE